MVKRSVVNGITPKPAQRYSSIAIQSVNREEEEAEEQRRKTRAAMINVWG